MKLQGQEAIERETELRDQIHRLKVALKESVSLQAHYALLLNMHDGGERMVFPNVDAWMARLRDIKKI